MLDEIPNDIVKMLRFFVQRKNFSYVDRIGNTLSVEAVEMALKDALRDLNSYYLSAQTDKEGRRVIIDRNENSIPLPNVPSQESISKYLELLRKDIGYARKLAILSLTWAGRKSKSEQKSNENN